jgi:hypothetical protein
VLPVTSTSARDVSNALPSLARVAAGTRSAVERGGTSRLVDTPTLIGNGASVALICLRTSTRSGKVQVQPSCPTGRSPEVESVEIVRNSRQRASLPLVFVRETLSAVC